MRFHLVEETSRTAFATRGFAAELRDRLSQAMASAPAGETVQLELSGVEAMTVSFADELVAKMVLERRLSGTSQSFFLLSGASPEVHETIEVALQRKGLFVAHRDAGGRVALCAAPAHMEETFDAAVELEEFTANQLATKLGMKLSAVNNRIRQLSDAGVFIRKRSVPASGGREYLYRAA